MKFLSDLQIEQGCDLYLKGVSNASFDMDMFVVADSGTKKLMYRTGTQVLSDIGASDINHSHQLLIHLNDNQTNSFPLPNSYTYAARFCFKNSNILGGTIGNFIGVLNFSPYDGTSASGGDCSYQLAFASTALNGGTPRLAVRNGINSTWNSWYEVITQSNIGSQSVQYATSSGGAPATDVYPWAKASTKPAYTYSEVGAAPVGTVSFPGFGTTGSTSCVGNDSRVLNGQTAYGWGNHSGLYTPIAHAANYSNPHATTAAQVSLGNVTNESKTTMFASPVFTSAICLDGTSGSHTEFLMKKAGAVGAANVGYYFSHRSTNTDLTLYSFNGSAYASVFEATRSGVTKWGASTYHVFQNYASTLQFETTSGGVNIPSGKTYQIGGVDAFAAVSSFSRDAAGYSGISYNPSDFVLHVITGINNAYTISGTTTGAANGMLHIIRLKDAGVSKTLGFSGFTAFKSSFPTATTPGKWMYFTCRYNSAGSSWDIIDFAVQN